MVRLGWLHGLVGRWRADDAFNGRSREVIGPKADAPEVITSAGVELGLLAVSRNLDREVASRVG